MQAYEEFLKDIFEEIDVKKLGISNSNIKKIKEIILNGERAKLQKILPREVIVKFLIEYLNAINKQGKESYINLIGNYTDSVISKIYIKTLLLVPYYYIKEGCLSPKKEERKEWLSLNNSIKEFLENKLNLLILTNDLEIDKELKEYYFNNARSVRSSAVFLYLTTLVVSKIFNYENIKNDYSNVDLLELFKNISFKEKEEEFIEDIFYKLKEMNDRDGVMSMEAFIKSYFLKEITPLKSIANNIKDIDIVYNRFIDIKDIVITGDYLAIKMVEVKEAIVSKLLGIDGVIFDIDSVFNLKKINDENTLKKEEIYRLNINIENFNTMLLSKYLLNNIVDGEKFFKNMLKVSFVKIKEFKNVYGDYTIDFTYNDSTFDFEELFINFKMKLSSILRERINFEERINNELPVHFDGFLKENILRKKLDESDNKKNMCDNIKVVNRKKI